VLALAASLALPATTAAQPAGVEPEAQALLRSSMDFLARQKRLTVDTSNTIETVLPSGQKLQFGHSVTMAMQRPNKLWAKRVGELVDQAFYYDGRTVTLHDPAGRIYATVEAPATIEEMLDFARTRLDIVAPAGDLVYRNAYDILMQDVISGFVVGKAFVEGARCDHLAFRAPHVDWQIWIQEGHQPLPRKLVITTRDIVNAPQFTVVLTKWNLAPVFGENRFTFKPPPGTRAAAFVLADEPPARK
jgi:hypothetical protein